MDEAPDDWTGERQWPLWKRILFPPLGLLILVGSVPAIIALAILASKF